MEQTSLLAKETSRAHFQTVRLALEQGPCAQTVAKGETVTTLTHRHHRWPWLRNKVEDAQD